MFEKRLNVKDRSTDTYSDNDSMNIINGPPKSEGKAKRICSVFLNLLMTRKAERPTGMNDIHVRTVPSRKTSENKSKEHSEHLSLI